MTMNSTNLQCKVKIGSAYEAKWFERRYTQGTYCGKNVPLDADGMWLQNAMIGTSKRRDRTALITIVAITTALAVIYSITYL
jgi:hypothetical protein